MTKCTRPKIETEVAVIGAGAAGCAAALVLGRAGVRATLVERGAARRDRFCGEFISGEATALLAELGVLKSVEALGPTPIARVRMLSRHGRQFELPLGARGWGLSRRALDGALLDEALSRGVRLIEHSGVEALSGDVRQGYGLRLGGAASGTEIRCRAVIGAHGKASQVDRLLGRPFVRQTSRYIGVKCRFEGVDREDRVELYLFPGGYCGVAGIERGQTNVCLLARRAVLAACGGRPMAVIEAVARHNNAFREWFPRARPIDETLMSIGQVPFGPKRRFERGVFMAGDSAGVLPPFLGVGVAAALGSGLRCGETVAAWLSGDLDADQAAARYDAWWRSHFSKTAHWGGWASELLCRPAIGGMAIGALQWIPAAGRLFYSKTRTAPRETWRMGRARG